jgi:hypothetical protein
MSGVAPDRAVVAVANPRVCVKSREGRAAATRVTVSNGAAA